MDTEALELARAFVSEHQKQERVLTFNVGETGEVVVISVGRVTRSIVPNVTKSIEESYRFIPTPSGSVCPRCNGTGRA